MNFYMYRYRCPRWYGTIEGFRNLYVEGNDKKDNENDQSSPYNLRPI